MDYTKLNKVFVIIDEYNDVSSEEILFLSKQDAEDTLNNKNLVLYPHGFTLCKDNYYVISLKDYIENLKEKADRYDEIIGE